MKNVWYLLFLTSLYIGWSVCVIAGEAQWERHMGAAGGTYQRGEYGEVERELEAALNEAEAFGEQDPRFAMTLNSLAAVYKAQGRYG